MYNIVHFIMANSLALPALTGFIESLQSLHHSSSIWAVFYLSCYEFLKISPDCRGCRQSSCNLSLLSPQGIRVEVNGRKIWIFWLLWYDVGLGLGLDQEGASGLP